MHNFEKKIKHFRTIGCPVNYYDGYVLAYVLDDSVLYVHTENMPNVEIEEFVCLSLVFQSTIQSMMHRLDG